MPQERAKTHVEDLRRRLALKSPPAPTKGELDAATIKRFENLLPRLTAFKQAAGSLLIGRRNLSLPDDRDELLGILDEQGLLSPNTARAFTDAVKNSLAERKWREEVNELPNQHGGALPVIPVLRFYPEAESFEADFTKKAPEEADAPKLRYAWWAKVAGWTGRYSGTLESKDAPGPNGIESFKGRLEGKISLKRIEALVDDTPFTYRWRGDFKGTAKSQGSGRMYYGRYNSKSTGDVAFTLELTIESGQQCWGGFDGLGLIQGTHTVRDNDGETQIIPIQEAANYGLPAFLTFSGSEMPEVMGDAGGETKIQGRVAPEFTDSVDWSLRPEPIGGGGGKDDPSGYVGNPIEGPYTPGAHDNNPYAMLKERLRTPKELGPWLRYSKGWFSEQIKYKRKFAVVETYRAFMAETDFNVMYDEVNEFEQHMKEELFRVGWTPK